MMNIRFYNTKKQKQTTLTIQIDATPSHMSMYGLGRKIGNSIKQTRTKTLWVQLGLTHLTFVQFVTYKVWCYRHSA